jgi:general secretion pathway protein L
MANERDNVMQPIPIMCHAKNAEDLIIVMPAEDILLTQVVLPSLKPSHIQKTLPYALEENLLTEVADLHFATGKPNAIDKAVPVAIITKQKMEEWVTLYKTTTQQPAAFLPITLILPISEHQWHAVIYDEIVTVRTGLYSGFVCDKNNIETFLTLKLAEESSPPKLILIHNYTDDTLSLPPEAAIREIKRPPSQFSIDLAQWARTAWQNKEATINLLQNIYPASNNTFTIKKIWQITGGLALGWIALLLISNLVSLFMLSHQTKQIDEAIHIIYKKNFPLATALVAPKQRMTEKLQQLNTQSSHVLFLLAQLGKSFALAPAIKLTQVSFSNNQLNVNLSAPAIDGVNTFIQSLQQQGLIVKHQNITIAGAQVKAVLTLQESKAS